MVCYGMPTIDGTAVILKQSSLGLKWLPGTPMGCPLTATEEDYWTTRRLTFDCHESYGKNGNNGTGMRRHCTAVGLSFGGHATIGQSWGVNGAATIS